MERKKRKKKPREPTGKREDPAWQTTAAWASILETSQRQVRLWIELSDFPSQIMRRSGRGGKIWLHGNLFFKWLIDTRRLPAKFSASYAEISKHRMGWEEARADKTRMQVDLMRGKYIDREEVKVALIKRVVYLKTGFLALLKSLPPRIEHKDARNIAGIMRRDFLQLLKEYSAPDHTMDGIEGEVDL